MSQKRVACPWCKASLVFDSGNWAYERSIILKHLTRCEQRPPEDAVAEVADRLTEEAREGHEDHNR